MSTSLAELDFQELATNRVLAAWGCWLLWATTSKRTGKAQSRAAGDAQ